MSGLTDADREALATIIMNSLRASGGINPNTHTVWTDWRPEADAILTSDWLAAREAEARRDERRKVAEEIEAYTNERLLPRGEEIALKVAARIARCAFEVEYVPPPVPGCLCEAIDYGIGGKFCPIHDDARAHLDPADARDDKEGR